MSLVPALLVWAALQSPDQAISRAQPLYWLSLESIMLSYTGDMGPVGEVLPLVSVAGPSYPMLAPDSSWLKLTNGKSKQVRGPEFYLPTWLVGSSAVDVFVSVIERDDRTPDDVLLPPRRMGLDIAALHFDKGPALLEKRFRFLGTYSNGKHLINEIHFVFRIRREAFKTSDIPDGMTLDSYFLAGNEVNIIKRRLVSVYNRDWAGPVESRLIWNFASGDTIEVAMAQAGILAESNQLELNRLRARIISIKAAPGLERLHEDYHSTLAQMEQQTIKVTVYGEKEALTAPLLPEGSIAELALPRGD